MNWFRYLPPLTAFSVSVALIKAGLLPLGEHALFLGVALVVPSLVIARFNGAAGAAVSGLWSVGWWWLHPGSAADALVFGIVAIVLLMTWILHLEKGAQDWDSVLFAVGFQALITADHWASDPLGLDVLRDLGPAAILAGSLVWLGHRLAINSKVTAYALLAALLPLPGATVPLAAMAVAALASTWVFSRAEISKRLLAAGVFGAIALTLNPAFLLPAVVLAVGRLQETRKRWILSLVLLVGVWALVGPPGPGIPETLTTSLLMAPFLFWGRNRGLRDGMAVAFLWLALAVALVPPLALPTILAFLLLRDPVGSLAVPERAWLVLLALGSLVLGSYPWGRSLPLGDTVSLVGMEPSWILALGCFVILGVVSVYADLRSSVGTVVVGLSALVLLGSFAPRGGEEFVQGTSLTLTADHHEVEFAMAGCQGKEIVLDSALANAVGLKKGMAVAEILIEGDDGEVAVYTLENGRDTGEWAHREAVEASPGAPWIYWNPEGVSFLGRRFRLRRDIEERPIRKVRIRRHPNLPPEVELSIFHLEIRG